MRFAERLTALMAERGASERALARQVNCDRSYIHLLKRGKRRPGPTITQHLDNALSAKGELVHLADAWRTDANRRSVLVGSGMLVAAMANKTTPRLALRPRPRPAEVARYPPGIDSAVVDSLAATLANQRRADDLLGPVAMREPVLAQLAAVEHLLRQARGPVRRSLLDVAQQWAQFAAYQHRQAGDLVADRALLAQTLEWATEIGDRTMIATVLLNRGELALLAGEADTVIGLAQAVQNDRRVALGPRVHGADLEVRGRALTGEPATAERKLGEAPTSRPSSRMTRTAATRGCIGCHRQTSSASGAFPSAGWPATHISASARLPH